MQYGGYTYEQVYQMNKTFPPLLELDVRRHLWPKLRFLEETIRIGKNEATLIPAQYFGARLERIIAPRHAFLVYHNLPHGRQLLQETKDGRIPWHDFLVSCRRTKQFCTLCNSWRQPDQPKVSAQQIEAFDALFQRGLMAAARDELCQRNNAWPLQHINITSGEIISLLIQHGANPVERDTRGVSLLHWAAGSGNLGAVQALLPHFQDGIFIEAERDGATPFHWAAAGATAREFGRGGHPEVCQYFLEQLDREGTSRLVNRVTKDGNSVLMWAAWSGTLGVAKLLIRNQADPTICNRNGCTLAHWAASGGNLEMCHYLAQTVGVNFTEPNYGGNTPLTHAVAFGREDVVKWLLNDIYVESGDSVAAELAKDFVGWTDGDRNREAVLNLFQDWFGRGNDSVVDHDDEKNDDDDDDGYDDEFNN
jgi:ankyrin repeat protein